MKLKVCGMRNQDNRTELLRLKPDYMGMIFYEKSSRHAEGALSEDFLQEMEDVKKTGVFVNALAGYVLDKVKRYQLHAVQLHGQESPDFCALMKGHNLEVIKVFSVGNGFDFNLLKPYEEVVDYFLFDTKGKHPGGNGVVFNWDILQNYPSERPFFLSGGISVGHVNRLKAFSHPKLYAIDINSRFEIEPALKDISLIQQLQNQLNHAT
ncbi:MAG: phosphoribosylanthranilate isomerase [Bacteroidota bacterium]